MMVTMLLLLTAQVATPEPGVPELVAAMVETLSGDVAEREGWANRPWFVTAESADAFRGVLDDEPVQLSREGDGIAVLPAAQLMDCRPDGRCGLLMEGAVLEIHRLIPQSDDRFRVLLTVRSRGEGSEQDAPDGARAASQDETVETGIIMTVSRSSGFWTVHGYVIAVP
ncbi:MAG: hypothetical protein ACOC5I_01265 [Gemmatimonadota bacterium]